MMRHYIDFFWKGSDYQILGNKTPNPMPKLIGFMSAIPVVPDGAMGAHDNHTINNKKG